MALSVPRLRQWFAVVAIFVCLIVAGAYFYGRHRVQNALKQVPEKLNIQIQQSAQEFTISKSEQGRTLFKLQAAKAVQFKQSGRVELHDVTIIMYGKESSRFDRIYGNEFEYDQKSGNVTSKGEVSIDLQSNPQGTAHPDQAGPGGIKNPIHLKTTDLVFNQKTGDAWTASQIEFYIPQVNGSAVGAKYDADANTLALESRVSMTITGASGWLLRAQHALLKKDPREIVLQHPYAVSRGRDAQADEATLFLRDDNSLGRAVASGNVVLSSAGSHRRRRLPNRPSSTSRIAADRLDLAMRPRNAIGVAVFSGNVHFEGVQATRGSAGRAAVSFAPGNKIARIHADQDVKIFQPQASATKTAQELEVTAPAMDLFMAGGDHLSRAETIGPPEILLFVPTGQPGPATQITAEKFTAQFDSVGQLSKVHGGRQARVVTKAPAQKNLMQPERVTTSDSIDAYFRPGTGIENLTQQGHFSYESGAQRAFADRATYTPADHILVASGQPRILDSGMETTARGIRLNRSTGEVSANGDVKTTYSQLKPQPGATWLASSGPVHITADSMTARNTPAGAIYKGHARLWQDANFIEAPTIEFQKDQRTVTADSNSKQKVMTALISLNKKGKATPANISSDHLKYSGADRRAHYSGSVIARSDDLTIASDQMDVFFEPSPQPSIEGRAASPTQSGTSEMPVPPQSLNGSSSKLDKIVATGSIVITQPTRHANGEKLTYTAADDKFILTGGPPSIFDAEHGKITGVSLTLFGHDDRVIVDGSSSSPAVTETRVVR